MRSSRACVATGIVENGGNGSVVERGAGQSWSFDAQAQAIGAGDNGVSCVSKSFCMTVGLGVMRWDGSAWSAEPVQDAENAIFDAVSCSSKSFCIAVGDTESDSEARDSSAVAIPRLGALIELWNGHRWGSVRIFVRGGEFDAVSCSSSRACIAVGGDVRPVAWNGRTWKHIPKPKLTASGVSCTAANDCLVVGTANTAKAPGEAARWNGRAWDDVSRLAQPKRAPLSVSGVSCVSARSCWTVGMTGNIRRRPVVEHWNGTTWSIQPTPRPPHRPTAISWELNAISCLKAAGCTAVGDYGWPSTGVWYPETGDMLIEHLGR